MPGELVLAYRLEERIPLEAAASRPEDRARAVEALGRVWSKVGFRHWRDGVWMLDLGTHDLQATLAELIAARSLDPGGRNG